MTREEIIDFYKGTEYRNISLSVRGIPPRPSEWNVPQFIKTIYHDNTELFKNSLSDNQIVIPLDDEDLQYFKAVLLHESMFNFYKAYYNYLSALKLYDGGLLHWIEITSYYSKLFIADSVIHLAGKSRYIVNGSKFNFVSDLFKLINPKKYQSIIDKHGIFKPGYAKYGIDIDINPELKSGNLKIIKDLGGGGSHSYIWNKYSEIKSDNFGITELTYDYPQHLSDLRNLENYSFEGYRQLDFNLDMENFQQYFQRDYIKKQSDMIYTSETAIVLGVIGELFTLYNEFCIEGLPIDKEKLKYMCIYSLGDNMQSQKLLDLIENDFPKDNKYLDEYNLYESN